MDLREASKILDEFRKALETENYSVVNQYTKNQLKNARASLSPYERRMNSEPYKELTTRIETLEKKEKKQKESVKWYHKPLWSGLILVILTGIITFLITSYSIKNTSTPIKSESKNYANVHIERAYFGDGKIIISGIAQNVATGDTVTWSTEGNVYIYDDDK